METVVYNGGAVKALGDGKVGGYLVSFGDSKHTDLEGDYFTPNTDFDLERSTKSTVLYQHGLDKTLKGTKLGVGEMKVDDAGVWIEAQLELRDDYERAIYDMAQKGKLGWSSGTAAHLVERKKVGKSYEIEAWALGLDASLTPTPAEPRCLAMSLKSWQSEMEDSELNVETKSVPSTIRDFEKFLREAGFSKSEAVKIASHGFGSRRDSDVKDKTVSNATYARVLETRLRTGVL